MGTTKPVCPGAVVPTAMQGLAGGGPGRTQTLCCAPGVPLPVGLPPASCCPGLFQWKFVRTVLSSPLLGLLFLPCSKPLLKSAPSLGKSTAAHPSSLPETWRLPPSHQASDCHLLGAP